MSMTRNTLALEIIESRSGNDRLNHCMDVLFDSADLDYDLFLVTIELIIKEAVKMKNRADQKQKNMIAHEAALKTKELKKKSRAAMIAKNLSDVDKSFFVDSINDSILSAALRVIKNNA